MEGEGLAMKTYRPITTLQFILMISTFQISVAFLALPRELARHAGTDGWMTVFWDGARDVSLHGHGEINET